MEKIFASPKKIPAHFLKKDGVESFDLWFDALHKDFQMAKTEGGVDDAIDELEEVVEEFDLTENEWASVDDASDYLFEHKYKDKMKKSWADILKDTMKAPRIPRKKGQKRNSKEHSDLYTDENPKGTIHGLGFKDEEKSRKSVSKIKNSNRSHAHKTQAAIAMEQRAREMGKTKEAAIYRKFIEQQKKKTEAKK